MSEMRYIQLGNLVELKQGMAINAKSNYLVSKEETPLALLRIADMPTKSKVIFMSENTPKRFIASEDDIIYTRTGQVGLVFRKQQGVVHNNCFRVIPNSEEKLDKGYLYWYLSLNSIRNFANSIASGSAQPDLPHSTFKKIRIWLPHITSQKKIAKILDQYELLIENNNKRIKLLEQMAENLYKEWFVRFRFPGYEDVEVEEKKPRGWQVGTEKKKHLVPSIFKYAELGNIGSFVRGKNITAAKMIEENIPVISAGLQPSGYHNEANVFGENLTISASGANAGYLQYNLNDIWAADCSYYQDNATIWFVYNTLKYLQPVISNLQCGAAQPHVYPKNINSLCILIPTEELIHKYNDFVKPYYDEIKVLNQHNQLLTQQRDMLLPRLMSGKLEV